MKHQANGEETVFKLHRSVKIEPNGNVTLWGLDAGHAHEPPQHISMKQRWFIGDPSTTTVVNADGDVSFKKKPLENCHEFFLFVGGSPKAA